MNTNDLIASLGADMTPAERVVFVAGDAQNRIAFVSNGQPTNGFAEVAGSVVDRHVF